MNKDSNERNKQIAERRAQMPKSCRANYLKATQGNSLRAAVNAFCMECVCWQTKEVRMCTELACPLYAVRPYRISQNSHDGSFSGVESTNLESAGTLSTETKIVL